MFAHPRSSACVILVALVPFLLVGGGRSLSTDGSAVTDRRFFFRSLAGAGTAALVSSSSRVRPALAGQETEYRQGIEVNAFNGLIFNYKGGDFNGLPADAVGDEPSVSYRDFNEKLKAGNVKGVEFYAPDGDVAYATFKDDRRVRIGEGYPVERHDGYSSPMFCVRAVKNAGVPYRFIVPALAQKNS